MFPDNIKSEAAFSSSYTRGISLAKKDAARHYIKTELLPDTINLSCLVQGSSGAEYETWVQLDLKDEAVNDYECDCPAHASYYGMCKHAVALALTFLEDEGVISLERSGSGSAHGNGSKGSSAHSENNPRTHIAKKPQPQPTSEAMDWLIASYAAAQRAPVVVPGAPGSGRRRDRNEQPAELEVTLARADNYYYRYYPGEQADDSDWEIRLKVCRGKASYVVKSIPGLISDWKNGSMHTYGKNLSFVHSRAAFSDRANVLLELLDRISRARHPTSGTYRYGGYYSSSYNDKTLRLSSADAIAVLDTMQDKTITWEYYGTGHGTTKQPLTVTEGAVDLGISLEPMPDGGYSLYPSDECDCVVTDDVFYALGNGRASRTGGDEARKAAPLLQQLFDEMLSLHVSPSDLPAFCSTVLPVLKTLKGFRAPAALEGFEPPEAEIAFKIGESEGYVTCEATVSYDDMTLGLFEPIKAGQPFRNAPRELAAQQLVREYFCYGEFPSPDYTAAADKRPYSAASSAYRNPTVSTYPSFTALTSANAGKPQAPWFPTDDTESLYYLMAEGLAELAQLGEVLLSDRLRAVEVRQSPTVNISASVESGLLDLNIDADGMSPADLIAYLASYRRRQRYIRLDNGSIMRLDDSLSALDSLADGLGLTPKQLVQGGKELPANRTLFVDALIKDAPGVRFNRNEAFRAIVRDFDTIADSDFEEPRPLRNVLRSYQREGFKWLSTLSALGFGGILADDMGLGKTLQLIALLLASRQRACAEPGAGTGDNTDAASHARPSLVVCPASLVYNWIAEIGKFAPELDAVPVIGTKPERAKLIGSADEHDVLVTSYDLMKRDIEAYESKRFDIVALDEAHYIKNSTTLAAKSAKRLPARVRFALTGTPIENRLGELWSIFDFLMCGILGSRESFAKRFEKPIIAGDAGAAARLRSLVGPFILRRLKTDVLRDLPDKNESVVYASMEGEQDKLYKATAARLALTLSKQMPEEFASNKLAILAELTKLRQLCCDPHLLYENYHGKSTKLETCMDLVTGALEGGHQVLLFSQFTSMLDIIAERFDATGVGYLMLTGSTPREERARRVERFQAGDAPVFLISLKAGGVGLNLTAADIVIHFDPWWNLSAQNQATDRAHRIGQTREVSVFKLIAKGTIEEKIVEMQEAKRELAESVIGGAGVSSTRLTREDVLALLDA